MPDRGRAASGLRLAAILVVTLAIVAGVAWAVVRGGGTQSTAASAVGESRPVPGQVAPDFTVTTLDGATVSLHDLRGRPVWLSFSATWCADCRSEAPDVEEAAAIARTNSVATVKIYTSDEAAAVAEYSKRLGLTIPSVPDPASAVAKTYRIAGVPTHYFIGADGVVRSIRIGAMSRPQMDAALADLTR